MKNVNFNELAKRAYENAKAKGFHDEQHTDGHYLMLVVCEVAEAVEADRSGKRADRKEYERLAGVCEERLQPHLFEMYIKDTVEDELADAMIRLLDFMGMKGFDVDGYMIERDILLEDSGEGELKPFTQEVFGILQLYFFDESVVFFMCDVFGLARRLGVDLIWFVLEKMKYNETRGMKHGKAY